MFGVGMSRRGVFDDLAVVACTADAAMEVHSLRSTTDESGGGCGGGVHAVFFFSRSGRGRGFRVSIEIRGRRHLDGGEFVNPFDKRPSSQAACAMSGDASCRPGTAAEYWRGRAWMQDTKRDRKGKLLG